MGNTIKITGIDILTYQYETHDLGPDDYYNSFNTVYTPGNVWKRTGQIMLIHTSAGITGEYVGGSNSVYAQMAMFIPYLIGKNPLQRELIYNDVKRGLRKLDRSISPYGILLENFTMPLFTRCWVDIVKLYQPTHPPIMGMRMVDWIHLKRLLILLSSVTRRDIALIKSMDGVTRQSGARWRMY